MAEKSINNSTIARIAGNIASGLVGNYSAAIRVMSESERDECNERQLIASTSVALARAIVAEVERADSASTETR